jgi:hypothetical protein
MPRSPREPWLPGAADACIAAKNQMLGAKTDEAFDRTERRVRLLCAD